MGISRECLVEEGPPNRVLSLCFALLCLLPCLTLTMMKMSGIVAFLCTCLVLFASSLANDEEFLGPGVSLLNCGDADMYLETLFYAEPDGFITATPTFEAAVVPAGSNSGSLSVLSDGAGSFYFVINSTPGTLTEIEGVVPKQVSFEGNEFSAYEVNANDFTNRGMVGVHCDNTKCEFTQSGPDTPEPVQYRSCDDSSAADGGEDLGVDLVQQTLESLSDVDVGEDYDVLLVLEDDASVSTVGDFVAARGGVFPESLGITGDATSLESPEALTEVRGDLKIQGNPQLTSLAGLESLTTVGHHFWVRDNSNLPETLDDKLQSLESVGGALLLMDFDMEHSTLLASISSLDYVGESCDIYWNFDYVPILSFEELRDDSYQPIPR